MAVAGVQKILIISHQSQSENLLKSIQKAGILHILDEESSTVLKADEELKPQVKRDRDTEETFQKLDKAITFLKQHHKGKPLATLLAPRVVVDSYEYQENVESEKTDAVLSKATELNNELTKISSEQDNLNAKLNSLRPWTSLEDDLANLNSLESVDVFSGMVPANNWQKLNEKLNDGQNGASVTVVTETKTQVYFIIVTLKQSSADVYKLLRAEEFEAINFEGLEGSVSENIEKIEKELHFLNERQKDITHQASKLADSLLELEMMYDHYGNKRIAGSVYNKAGITERTRIFEGWVKKDDMHRLKEIVMDFDASSVCPIEPEPDEQVPVEIENKKWAKPFEIITNLYGKPQYFEVDPTVVLAPFFAIFFALCLTDAGYGLLMIGVSIYMMRKMQTGKSFMKLLLICSVLTVFAGAMTGGWFGSTLLDAAQKFNIGWLETFIQKTTWFNPLEDPMTFLVMSIILGYLQIMIGLVVGFFNILKNNGLFAAVCDKLTWLVMLNSFLVMAASKAGYLSPVVGKVAVLLIYVSAAMILFLSHREGGIGARIGMGSYNLFSAIFYLGDLLSYLRLMALGMATGGVAMAVNIIAGIIGDTPYVGPILAIIFLVCGHIFNVLQSLLGAFVHSMRLQFVEFFPKFLEGGGKPFEPFAEEYKYVYIKEEDTVK
ncbi:MAG: V-type ATP synthase subunit I [Sedimentisphaeraceae bacterium JB056]